MHFIAYFVRLKNNNKNLLQNMEINLQKGASALFKKKTGLNALLLTLLLTFSGSITSQVVINEFSATNTGSVIDPDFYSSSDWVELYNKSTQTINLKGFYLTDDSTKLSKWQIKNDLILQPEGFTVIWCDGLDTLNVHSNFKLSASGESIILSDANLKILDQIVFDQQESNLSWGRKNDGGSVWVYFTESSPGSTNIGKNYDGIIKNVPYFSPLGGIFSTSQTVTIKNIFPGEIRYTLDGSEPTSTSDLYSAPIPVSAHTIIRARIFNGDNIKPGDIVTSSYFIGNDMTKHLPVVSIASNPENFWDPAKGIYVQSFKPEWEVPVNIELFENDGSDRAGLNEQAGVKINGLWSWQLPQKMLGVYFRKEYGTSKLDYPVILDQEARSYDDFALRASGNDWSETLFRDAMLQKTTQLNMNIEYQGYRPAVLYINGEYMGINNLRQKVDKGYIKYEEHISGNFDMIENEDYVEEGSLERYAAFKSLYSKDLSIQQNYDTVAKLMDIPNFMDFITTELYSNNTSTGHNVMAWKAHDSGKWRWILNDFDRGMGDPSTNLSSTYTNKTIYPMSRLLQNSSFKETYIYRLADQLYTTFNPQRMYQQIDSFAGLIRDELPRHLLRWKGATSSYGDAIPSLDFWEAKMASEKTFAAQRGIHLLYEWKTYGLNSPVELTLANSGNNSGLLLLNGMKVPAHQITGKYPDGGNIKLKAIAKPGFTFNGWSILADTALVARQSTWKYNDKGVALTSGWINASFDDSAWSSGQGEFGYGDGGESTIISYGSSSSNKYITSYFRKKFYINSKNGLILPRLLLRADDGAIVYVNGQEAVRFNLTKGDISFSTFALRAIAGNGEIMFQDYFLDPALLVEGENIIAVEVHQSASNSSDLSFDLQLLASRNNGTIVSSADEFDLTLSGSKSIMANYSSQSICLIPSHISSDYTLEKACSPYYTQGDVILDKDATLTIEPGVEIYFANNSNFFVHGNIKAMGTENLPIKFTSDPDKKDSKWNSIILQNGTDTTFMSHCTFEKAGHGPNPIWQVAALSIFNSVAKLDHITIKDVNANPIAARFSDVSLQDSYLHSKITGDLINIKYGKGHVSNCEFLGNDMPDTDAIDFDGVKDGVIENCLIHELNGPNSDAIDVGEQTSNIHIDNMMVYNVTDKGVSMGQRSSGKITNSTFINCNLGAGLKDSTKTVLDHNTYYGCAVPIAAYEKNIGDAGGNAIISNSIFTNINTQPYLQDDKSSILFNNCLSDIDTVFPGTGQIYGDPLFYNVSYFDFRLDASSPANVVGHKLGSSQKNFQLNLQPVISSLYPGDDLNTIPEFIVITNPDNVNPLDISGYSFTDGIEWTAMPGTILPAGGKIAVTGDISHALWTGISSTPVEPWLTGKLNNAGERIQLSDNSGIIIDQIDFSPGAPWPTDAANKLISLKSLALDNHFGKNWEVDQLVNLFTGLQSTYYPSELSVYPNPVKDFCKISGLNSKTDFAVYDQLGRIIMQGRSGNNSEIIDLSGLEKGIYILKQNKNSIKLIKQ